MKTFKNLGLLTIIGLTTATTLMEANCPGGVCARRVAMRAAVQSRAVAQRRVVARPAPRPRVRCVSQRQLAAMNARRRVQAPRPQRRGVVNRSAVRRTVAAPRRAPVRAARPVARPTRQCAGGVCRRVR